MTGLERMKAVMSGELPDRVPFFPTIYTTHACVACGRSFEDALINPAVGAECMLGAATGYGTDAARFIIGPEASWYEDKIVERRDDRLVQIDRRSGLEEGCFDVEGGGALVPYVPPPRVSAVKQARALEVTTADEYIERGCLKDLGPLVGAAHEKGLFVVGLNSSQTINFMVEKMGGPEAALMSFYDDPGLALALIDKAVAISIERGKAFIKAGVDCLYIGDSYASGSVISPDIYERFCVPAYRETAAELRRHGVFVYKHCCGNYNPFLDSLPSVGVDAMDGIDPTSGMTVKHTKEKIGDRLTLMGGVSCLNLLNGTPGAVYDEARQCVLDGKPGGRYVLGSACAVAPLTPRENLLAVRRAAVDHGQYPGHGRA